MNTEGLPLRLPPVGTLLVAVLLGGALVGCEREQRRFVDSPPFGQPTPIDRSGYEQNAWAVAEGKRWFRWYNCNGCHGNGGGGMGPALADDQWRYGHAPTQIVESILQGRPNGMPAFAARMPEDQAWQLAAYIRSMSGQLRTDVAPSRSDSISPGEPEQRREKLPLRQGDLPPPPPK
jgi:cytochrome c oxidase cbb3-type subunit III